MRTNGKKRTLQQQNFLDYLRAKTSLIETPEDQLIPLDKALDEALEESERPREKKKEKR